MSKAYEGHGYGQSGAHRSEKVRRDPLRTRRVSARSTASSGQPGWPPTRRSCASRWPARSSSTAARRRSKAEATRTLVAALQKFAPPELAATIHHEVRQQLWSSEAVAIVQMRNAEARDLLYEQARTTGGGAGAATARGSWPLPGGRASSRAKTAHLEFPGRPSPRKRTNTAME